MASKKMTVALAEARPDVVAFATMLTAAKRLDVGVDSVSCAHDVCSAMVAKHATVEGRKTRERYCIGTVVKRSVPETRTKKPENGSCCAATGAFRPVGPTHAETGCRQAPLR